jgi:hypothetical protein
MLKRYGDGFHHRRRTDLSTPLKVEHERLRPASVGRSHIKMMIPLNVRFYLYQECIKRWAAAAGQADAV